MAKTSFNSFRYVTACVVVLWIEMRQKTTEAFPREGCGLRNFQRQPTGSPKLKLHHYRISIGSSPNNESAPDSIESRALVRAALPRSLLTPTLRSDLYLHNDPFVTPPTVTFMSVGMENRGRQCGGGGSAYWAKLWRFHAEQTVRLVHRTNCAQIRARVFA